MISIGDFVYDRNASANVRVLEINEAWGYTTYKVFNPSTGAIYRADADQLQKDGGDTVYDENYLRYVNLLAKIKNETASGILSSISTLSYPAVCTEKMLTFGFTVLRYVSANFATSM